MTKKNSLLVLMYHYVRNIKKSHHPNIKGVELDLFKLQLDYIKKKFNIISAEDLINFFYKKKELPENSCLLTFDDGYKDHIDFVLPELLKRKMKGIFFPQAKSIVERELSDVNAIHFILDRSLNDKLLLNKLFEMCLESSITQKTINLWIKKNAIQKYKYDSFKRVLIKRMLQYLIPDQLRKNIISKLFKEIVGQNSKDFANDLYLTIDDLKRLLNSGMQIGSHGYEHSYLNKLSYADQKKDLNNSIRFLDFIGISTNNWVMCYPYGAYNKNTVNILKKSKCALAFIDSGGRTNLDPNKRFELTRHDIKDFTFKKE